MILKEAIDLRRRINAYRQKLNILAAINGISNPEVIMMSQQLDDEIIKLQKILYEMHSSTRRVEIN